MIKHYEKLFFSFAIFVLISLVGLHFYGQQLFERQTASTNLLTGAAVDDLSFSAPMAEIASIFRDCGQFNTSTTCTNADCFWKTQNLHSWCEPVDCFDADNTNQTFCLNLNATYNLSFNCAWTNLSGVGLCDPTGGDFFGDGCTDFNNDQQGCYKTMFCIWNSTANTCTEPAGGFSNQGPGAINPSCAVVADQHTCLNITGCTWAANACTGNSGGITCANLNKSICSDVTFLSSCCSYNGTNCKTSFDQSCYSAIPVLPTGGFFCEDYVAFTNQTVCNQIAASPWYMPCTWDNTSGHCHFNSEAFGGSSSFDEIGTELGCEAQGGLWKTEQYSDPLNGATRTDSWCEFNFGSGGNCDSSCWACEKDSDVTSLATAETVCENSDLGYCEFQPDSHAVNGYGWCQPKQQFMDGGGKSCDDECSACDYLQHPQAQCQNSTANCVFDVDTSAPNAAGYCYGDNEKRCANDCFSCYTSSECFDDGKGGNGACSWDSLSNFCKPVGYSDEVCFDGKDNDNDGKVDCDDSGCSTDKFCGGAALSDSFGDCPSFQSNSTCSNAGCVWLVDDFQSEFGAADAGFCDFPGAQCWQHDENVTACNLQSSCIYLNQTGGICDINATMEDTCFEQRNQTACGTLAGCAWNNIFGGGGFGGGGWCELVVFKQCYNNQSRQSNQASCEINESIGGTSAKICTWSDQGTGFIGCHPTGFTQTGTTCGNGLPAGLGLFQNVSGLCEPKAFGGNCLQGDGNQTHCQTVLNQSCTWFSDAFANNNVSNHTTPSGNSSGWCNGKGAGNFVQFIGDIEPEVLEVDENESNVDDRYDIEGIGLRDTFEKFMFGTRLYLKFNNSATCSGVPTYTSFAPGTGLDNYTFFWYMDSDGNSTNGCRSRDNSSLAGFEFSFKYKGSFDTSLKETKVSYQCVNSSWGAVPIPLITAADKACRIVGGGMVGVDKKELFKFRNAFNRSADLRLYATVNSAAANDTMVNDSIGPTFYSLGAIDFRFEDCSDSGADEDNDGLTSANDPDCMDFLKFGYVPNEIGFECYDGIDNDADNKKDCSDEGCSFTVECGGSGVPRANDSDKNAPTVIWLKENTFPDAAMVTFDTDEPANGTVQFYRNDSTCKTINKTVRDAGILDNFVASYKMWHDGPLDNFNGNPEKLGFGLSNGTTYFYKTRVCDISGNCAVSACLNFTTKSTFDDCKSCKTTLSFPFTPPTGAGVTNPLGNLTFSFEYADGTTENLSCNTAIGKQLNYSRAKDFSLVIENPTAANDSKWRIKLINVSLSGKLSSGVQNFSGGSDLQFNATTNGSFVGLGGTKCQQLVNALRPKRLEIGIPGNASQLWQCTSALNNCTDKTSNATRVGYNATTNITRWVVPAEWGC